MGNDQFFISVGRCELTRRFESFLCTREFSLGDLDFLFNFCSISLEQTWKSVHFFAKNTKKICRNGKYCLRKYGKGKK